MYYLLPIFAILLLLIFLIVYGKPRKITFRTNGYLDSFEKIDYNTDGRHLTPFKPWNVEKEKFDHLPYMGEFEYRSPGYFFNWNSPVYLRLHSINVPDGFELFLKPNSEKLHGRILHSRR